MTVPPSQPSGWQQPAEPQIPYGQPGHAPAQPAPGGYQPPPPGTYLPPPSGYQPPPPVAKRIPEDQPFVVHPSARKRGLIFGSVALVMILPIGCLLGFGAAASDDGMSALAVLGLLGFLVVPIAGLLGFQLWLVTSGGPVLAVGPAGMWIKTRPTRGQAIWLPWEGIAHISRRRWSLEKMVVVKPRDPRVGSNLGAFTALDSSMLQLFYGSGFTATLNLADKPETEIVAAITHLSAGRCHITW